MSEATRAWIYRAVTVLLALAAGYGFISDEQQAGWSSLAGVLIGLLASFNTSTSSPQPPHGV